MNQPIYQLEHVSKKFSGPAEDLIVLNDVTMNIAAGQSLAVIGASGSGKSTLLHLLGTLDTPSAGSIFFSGRNIRDLSPEAKALARNRDLGFVFQFHHLLPEFSTLENVAMQAVIGGAKRSEALAEARKALELVGLEDKGQQSVTTLSGGERQRAAIARAILKRPKVLLADEPTGNLDEKTGQKIARLLLDLNHSLGMTLVMVTHNRDLAVLMDRCLELRAGELYEQTL